MSKIIKGGHTKFFNFFWKEGEETFNPLKTLLPEEALTETEKGPEGDLTEEKTQPEVTENTTQVEEGPKEAEREEVLQEEPAEPAPLDLAQLSLEELRAHPEISAKLALLEQEAYEKGFAQGQKDGELIGRKKYETLANRLAEILKNLEKDLSEHILALEPQLLALVKLMVEKLVLKEVDTDAQPIKASLREALKHVVEQTQVKIHLHPDDTEFLDEILAELREEFSKIKDFEIVPNPNLKRGGCLLETDFGLVDATLERRWQEILKRLEDEGS